MNPYQELEEKKYLGFYRAQIIEVNSTLKNGIYKVKAYPFMADIDDQFLPPATCILTTREKHVSLYEDDWVWVFFENGNKNYPVIIGRCNVKDDYPDAVKGTTPSYYSDITPNSNIDETTVSYGGSYGTVQGFDFGDNIHVEIDEENEQVVVLTSNAFWIIDKNGDFHTSGANSFITMSGKFNVGADTMKLKIGSNEITADTQGFTVNNNFRTLI